MVRHIKNSSRMVYEQMVNYRTAEPRPTLQAATETRGVGEEQDGVECSAGREPEVEEDFVKWLQEAHMQEIGATPALLRAVWDGVLTASPPPTPSTW